MSWAVVFAAVGGVWLSGGCERGAPPPAPATQPRAPSPPKLTLLNPERDKWSLIDALMFLPDEESGLSAAVRLVRLSGRTPLVLPEGLSDATVVRLRLLELAEGVWALGIRDPRDEGLLRAPVLILAGGDVEMSTDGVEEELTVLRVSDDTELMPHLLVSPHRVWILRDELKLALTRAWPDAACFRQQADGGVAYVTLRLAGANGVRELAEYRWEPFELGFVGPASDALPDPPGGTFALDMDASPLLIPVGGVIPDPAENVPPPERPRALDIQGEV